MNKFKGLVLAILFAAVASIPWIILGHLGWIASIAGYLIGLAGFKGYVRGNGDFDRFGKISLAAIIILTIPIAEMVNIFLFTVEAGYPAVQSLLATPLYFFDYLGEFLPSILIGYFMAFLGTYQFFFGDRRS